MINFRLSATTTADFHARVEEKVSVDLLINPHYATVNGMDLVINFNPADLQLTNIEDLSRIDFPNSALVFIPDLPFVVQTATSQGIIRLSALQNVNQPSGLTGDEGYLSRLSFIHKSAASTTISINRESTIVAVDNSNKNALGEVINLLIPALPGPTTPVVTTTVGPTPVCISDLGDDNCAQAGGVIRCGNGWCTCVCPSPSVSIPPSMSPTPKPSCSPIACTLYCANGFVKDANGCDLCSCIPDPRCPVNQNGRPVCPVFTAPSEASLCPYGNWVPRGKDRCGCPLPPRCKRCLGDVNHSGKVDYRDVLQVMRKFGRCKVKANCPEDLDQNGKVDRYDFKIVRKLVGTKCNMSPEPTPQPTPSPTPLPTQQPLD